MAQNPTNDKSDNTNKFKKFVDEATQDKIHKHLMDINDTISEQDIKNIKTDISSPEPAPDKDYNQASKDLENQHPAKAEDKASDGKDDMPTSWNVLDEN